MLSGDNGILQRSTDAKTYTNNEQIKERIKLAYHSALTVGKGSYTKKSLMEELKNEFETDYDVDDSNNENWKMIAHGQEVIIPAGEEDTPSEEYLKLREGDTVYYKDVNNNDIECIVLYDSENENYSSYGVQIITKNPVVRANIGNGIEGIQTDIENFNKARDSYNNANSILNTAVKNYVTENSNLSDIAKNSRCLYSDPVGNATVSGIKYSHREGENDYFEPYDEQFEMDTGTTQDILSGEDGLQLQKLNISLENNTNGYVWFFGSRRYRRGGMTDYTAFFVDFLNSGASWPYSIVMSLIHSHNPRDFSYICWVDENGNTCSRNLSGSIYPVITLKSSIKVIELDGKKYIEI